MATACFSVIGPPRYRKRDLEDRQEPRSWVTNPVVVQARRIDPVAGRQLVDGRMDQDLHSQAVRLVVQAPAQCLAQPKFSSGMSSGAACRERTLRQASIAESGGGMCITAAPTGPGP
jgi:hypothetical protein